MNNVSQSSRLPVQRYAEKRKPRRSPQNLFLQNGSFLMYVKTVVSDWQGLERNPSLLVDSDAAEANIIKCKK